MFFRTATKIAFRELGAAPGKFGFVVLAVAIGVAILTGVKSSGAAFKNMLLRNARQLIAADVQGQIWALATPDQLARMDALGHRYGEMTRVTETVSMAGARGVPQMVSVKAVDPGEYPYYGNFELDPKQPLASAL